ncbi:MAG: AAA family ATPase [Desulfococcaceae bacterium]
MKIIKLDLNNYRCFHKASFTFSDHVNVLVGNNGVGKSSVLNALAILLSRLIWRIRSNRSTGRQFSPDDVTKKKLTTSNSITISLEDKEIIWTVGRSRAKGKKQTITNLENLSETVNRIHRGLDKKDNNFNIPLAVYYSVNRAVLDVPLRIRKTHIFEPSAAYDDALSDKRKENDFRLFFEWFRNREDLENENRRYLNSKFKPDNFEFPDMQLEAVRKALSVLMPDFKELQVRRSPLRMVVNKSGVTFEITQLSDGEKCMLAMVGDLARRLALANPGLDDPLLGAGVIMIDEIELHLHPAWQRVILSKLGEAFPRCQFIVSTHSPQVLSEVTPENIWILTQDRESDEIKCQRPSQTFGLDSCEILEEVMVTPSRNLEVSKHIEHIFDLIDNDKFERAKEEIARLKTKVRGSLPDIVQAEAMITMLEDDSEVAE